MILQLTQAFSLVNEELFDSCLSLMTPEEVDFEVNEKRKCIFHFSSPATIEIGSGFLDAKMTEVVDDLIHVMVHMTNFKYGVTDHTVNQYHNRHFVERALGVGLIVAHHKTRGWAITASDPSRLVGHDGLKVRYPEEDVATRLKECSQKIHWSELEFENFKSSISRKLAAKPQKEYQLKYICECDPPVIVRSGRRPDGQNPLNITCNDCNAIFVLEN